MTVILYFKTYSGLLFNVGEIRPVQNEKKKFKTHILINDKHKGKVLYTKLNQIFFVWTKLLLKEFKFDWVNKKWLLPG